jgi:nitroreductase
MHTDLDPSTDRQGVDRLTSRRAALQFLGLSAGAVAVAGSGGLTWLASTGGVFSTGTGAAYAAWSDTSPNGDPVNLIRAAILAANAHNTQPWLFTVTDDRIELHADMSRTIGAMDPLLREMHISLGCAVENLTLAGPSNGIATAVTLLPDPADATHIATIALTWVPATRSTLFDAIADRHTNRSGYDTSRPVSAAQRDTLSALVDVPGTQLVWFSTATEKRAFGDLTIRATKAIIADPQQAADDFRWYRSDWHDIQSDKDGITIDPSGQSPLIRAVSKLLPTTQEQANDGWLTGTRDTQVPTAAAFGAIVVTDPRDNLQRLRAGRIWQRMHLTATAAGLAMQPLCQIPERIDREASANLPPDFTTAMAALLPPGTHPVMTFRVGYPTVAAPLSPRRPAADVIHA